MDGFVRLENKDFERLNCLKIIVVIWKISLGSIVQILLVFGNHGWVHLNLWRSQSWHCNKLEVWISEKLSSEPKERLFEVVVRFRRDVVILEILLTMESDSFGLDFAIFDVDLVSAKNDRNVLAYSGQVAMPVRYVLVGDTSGNIEHNDGTLSLDIISVTKATELLLSSGIPHVETNLSAVGVEDKWVDFDTKSSNILLFKLSGQVTLNEGGFSGPSISNEDKLESRDAVSDRKSHV